MQNKDTTQRILSYRDLIGVQKGTSDQKLVDVRTYDPAIVAEYDKLDMETYTGDVMLVRDEVAQKLAAVNQALLTKGYTLKVVYGYRHPNVQKEYFDRRRAELNVEDPALSEEELDEATHAFVAVPDVAGHPTGGAVDVTIIDKRQQEIDMGNDIADYTDPQKICTFASGLSEAQASNRRLLLGLMTEQGFAPFYGEWWHFSYGDQEWAAFYNKKTALYSAIEY